MDLSEYWRIISLELEYGVVFALAGVGFYLAFRLSRRWTRFLLFAISSLIVIMCGLAIWFDISFIEGSRMRGPAILSPDQTHVAVIYWDMSGAIGFDHVNVAIRNKYSPFATEVFREIAQSPPDDPKVLWQDDQHLLITYRDQGTVRKCKTEMPQFIGIELLCKE